MKSLYLIIVANLFILNVSFAKDVNCDATSLTYDKLACEKTEMNVSILEADVSDDVQLLNAFDAAAEYDKKLRKLDKSRKIQTAAGNDEYGMYLATNSKAASNKPRVNKGMESQLSKVDQIKKGSKLNAKPVKNNFDQVGIGAKIPLKSN
jgi:hypothetical protein